MKYLVFLLISFSIEAYADDKKYINEFDTYLSYINNLHNSNMVVIVDSNLVSDKFIYRLKLKAKLIKKTIKIINRDQGSLLVRK